MIDAIDTTNVTWTCPVDSVQNVDAVSGLEAGTDQDKNAVRLPACSGCGNYSFMFRTWANPMKQAGAVNGLHEYLIDQAQTNSNWTATFAAETPGDKPILAYVPTGSPASYTAGTNGRWPYDSAQVITILGTTETKARIETGAFWTDDNDSTVTTMINSLYATTADRTKWSAAVKARRLSEFSVSS